MFDDARDSFATGTPSSSRSQRTAPLALSVLSRPTSRQWLDEATDAKSLRRLTQLIAPASFDDSRRKARARCRSESALPPDRSRSSESSAAAQEAVFRFLADSRTHRLSEPVARVDTAAAVVFLAGSDAYKVKRAVAFPFMDLSTLEKRRLACEAEIAVNRADAPAIYLAALPIVRRGGTFEIGGKGEIVEWAVHMRRFDEEATLDRIAAREGVSDAIIDKLTLAIRRSHARAPLRGAARCAHALEAYIEQNDAAFAERPDLFDAAKARRLTVDSRLTFAVARPLLLRRGESGFTRRCHGDLHLNNIVMLNGEPTLFDALEFSDDVASGDVLYDLAFLLMDLEARGLRRASNRLFNRYLAPEPPEAMAGLQALPLFMSLRAAIRAKVKAAGADRLEGAKRDEARTLARGYFECAAEFLRYASPRLIAVGGLSGAGKSALAGALAPWLGRAPGGLWLRSDLERKAMFGVEETVRLPASAYFREVTSEVYERLMEKARIALRVGQTVLLDATFATAVERRAAAGVAAEVGVAFAGFFLEAPLAARLNRIAARSADASDADADVARRQTAEPLGERGWSALAGTGSAEESTNLALARLSKA
jgi:aminoglycoside phosphotransferase family enzyme/predicted kinase